MEIKPCPFCGEKETGRHAPKPVDVGGPVFGHIYAVVCENCGSMGCTERVKIKSAETKMSEAIDLAKKEAVLLWNRRYNK